MLESPAYRQYRGTETDEIVRKPGPVNRGLNKTDGDGATEGGIMAKDPEDRRMDSDTMRKVARACLEVIKIAASLRKPIGLAKPPSIAQVAQRAKDPGIAFATQGGDRFRMDRTGASMIQDNGTWRPANMRHDADRLIVQNRANAMSNLDRHRMMTKLRDASGNPLRKDTFGNRLLARGADVMSHPLAPMFAPMAAQAAMRLIPMGRDEYGNRRTLADTAVGQIGSAMLPFAVPYLAGRGSLGQAGSRLMGSHVVHTPPPSPHIGG